jgi:hypothetical protein
MAFVTLTPTELLAFGVDVNFYDLSIGESFSTFTRTYVLIAKDPLVSYDFSYIEIPQLEEMVRIKEEDIPTQGYMELQGVVFNIPAGATGSISMHTMTIEQSVNIYCINVLGTNENADDTFSFYAGPADPIGALSQDVNPGDTGVFISSPVLSYYVPGFSIGTATSPSVSLGRVKTVDVENGKITLRNPTTHTYPAGTYVYLWATRGSDIPMTNAIMELGNGKIGGSYAQEGLKVTFFYTNNTGLAKKLKLLIEDTY